MYLMVGAGEGKQHFAKPKALHKPASGPLYIRFIHAL